MRADGPYCPWPQDHSRYVHEVYPRSRAVLLDVGGTIREATPQELERFGDECITHLMTSFRYPKP